MKRDLKIITCLLLIRERILYEVINSMKITFNMSYTQINIFFEILVKRDFIEYIESTRNYSLTQNGENLLRECGVINMSIQDINNQNYEVDEDFYYSYFTNS